MNPEEIRALTKSDSQQVVTLVETLDGKYTYPFGGLWSLSQVQNELEAVGGVGLFAKKELQAFILFRKNPEALEITFLAVRWGLHGKGYMRTLLRNHLSDSGVKKVWLEVHAENQAAQAFYQSMGFDEVGRRPNYYPDGSAAINFSWMST